MTDTPHDEDGQDRLLANELGLRSCGEGDDNHLHLFLTVQDESDDGNTSEFIVDFVLDRHEAARLGRQLLAWASGEEQAPPLELPGRPKLQ